MMKMILLAGTMAVAAPAFAQTTPAADPAAQAPMAAAPADGTTSPQQAPGAEAAPATTAAQPATDGAQVAQAVDTQFGTYDRNADGKLDRAEFGAWMVALKTASDPAIKAESAETKKWVGAAFAQADADRNRSLSKTEVTGFLSQGQS